MRIFNSQIKSYKCDRGCKDGWVIDSKDNIVEKDGKFVRCQCHYEDLYLTANIGKSYWDLTTENFDGHPKDLAGVEAYIDNLDKHYPKGTGMYIHGGNGAGKTTLALLILKHVLHSTVPCSVLFAPFADVVILNSRIVGGFSDKEAEKAINYIKNVDFLVLDDIGKEFDNGKDYTRATLNSILRYRDMWNKPTIYTSNNPIEKLRAHYGDANYSIMEGRSIILSAEYDRDYRKEKKMDI
jgi:DNA replication protein DnaC